MARRINEWRGVSLLELLAVVTLIGILASVAIMRYGRTIFGDFGSQAEARILSLGLLQAQRAAVTSGDNHFVQFDSLTPTSYRIFHREATGPVLVDGPHILPAEVTATVSDTEMEFTFEGQALGAYVVTLAGDARSWRIDVIPINGAIRVTDTTP